MTVETKRFIKKASKISFWAVGDVFFLALKAIGTTLLVAVTTGAVFVCIFLIYLRTNMSTGLDVNPDDFVMSLSSVICYIDPETGREHELATLQSTEFRRLVEYSDIPEHMIYAVVSIEDHRYFRHNGVDWYRTAGAFMNMFLGMKDTFGGSTITQQLIKNLTSEDDVTVQRKLQEIFRALEFERQFNKEEILERYLNLVYFGHGCYGIGAAADYYFGKDASDLTLAESAAIIGITNNPSMYSPYANKEANKERQETILGRMFELGYIESEQDLRRAMNAPLNFQRGDDYVYEQVIYPWFVEAVIWEVIADLQNEKGYSEQWAKRRLYTGGLKIIATINMDMQAIVDEIYQNPDSLPRVTGSSQPLQSSIVIADPYTGEILALSGGVGKKTRNMLLNRATMSRRPPGSALKPISCYAPAMEYGILTPETLYDDSEYVSLSGTTWMPRNADRSYSGIVSVRQAIRVSLNTIPAVVLDQLGPSVSYRFMRDALGFGLHPADEDYAPLAAGQLTRGATVREMASGFTMFPNGGERSELRTYSRVYDADGDIYLDNTPRRIRVISDTTAYWMTDMLHGAVTGGTGGAANLGTKMPTAGKTGTSTDSKDRWFVGFTPYYLAAVWTGFDTPATMRSTGNPAAQIWKMIMAPIHEGLESRQFDKPEHIVQRPVSGVETSLYTVRCLDTMGNVIRETSTRGVVGRELVLNAQSLQYYVVVGESSVELAVSNDPGRNIVTFVYRWVGPEDQGDKEDTEGGGDGEDGGDADAGAGAGAEGGDGNTGETAPTPTPVYPPDTETPPIDQQPIETPPIEYPPVEYPPVDLQPDMETSQADPPGPWPEDQH